MAEIKAMTEDEIKAHIEAIQNLRDELGIEEFSQQLSIVDDYRILLTVLEAWARIERYEFDELHDFHAADECPQRDMHRRGQKDWLNAVKQRIGWKD